MSTTDAKVWSERIATLAVDGLLDAGIVKKEDFENAVTIAAREIKIRLNLRDYPTVQEQPNRQT